MVDGTEAGSWNDRRCHHSHQRLIYGMYRPSTKQSLTYCRYFFPYLLIRYTCTPRLRWSDFLGHGYETNPDDTVQSYCQVGNAAQRATTEDISN
jgi:hypothetical protein